MKRRNRLAFGRRPEEPYSGGVLANARMVALVVVLIFLTAQPLYAERLALAVKKANVRSGPGTDKYEILWEIERFHPIQVIQRQGEWIFFKDFEGDEGWIHQRLVDKTKTVITRKDMVNIRTGPGTDAAIGFQAEKGVPLKVMERKGDWIRIQSAYGDKGWIHRKLVW